MRILLIEEEHVPLVVIYYRIDLLGEVVPRFPTWVQLSTPRLKYYNKVLKEHIQSLLINPTVNQKDN